MSFYAATENGGIRMKSLSRRERLGSVSIVNHARARTHGHSDNRNRAKTIKTKIKNKKIKDGKNVDGQNKFG